MQMLDTAKKLDWSSWLRGIFGALISGGAGSVAAGFSTLVLDKQHDVNVFEMMGITFLFSGVVSLAKFLQVTPVPDIVTVEVKQTTTAVVTQKTETTTNPSETQKL